VRVYDEPAVADSRADRCDRHCHVKWKNCRPNEHNDLPPKSRTKPTTARFDVINLFDKVYEIRDGSGIGVFAPQFGARRAFYAGLSQKF